MVKRGFPHPASLNPINMLTTDQILGKGRYRVIGNFTQSNAGGLYEAYDTVSNTTVILRETVGSSGGVVTPTQLDAINEAFAGEAKALREVKHESLLNVQDHFSEIDRHYLVMESVDGFDLTKFLQPEENVPALGDVLKWMDQVLDALDYLHCLPKPLVHRDVRPANIRLTSNFKVKLLTAGAIGGSDLIMASGENASDASILDYRPLEQLWGGLDPASQKVISNSYDDRSRRILQQPLDARSDIYSVGATLYHVITRTLPKDALERSIEILDGNSDPLVPPAELDPSIPEEISEVIMKSMELRREHRYDSAAIMRQVLESAQKRAKSRISAEPKTRIAPEPLVGEKPAVTVEMDDAVKSSVPPAPQIDSRPDSEPIQPSAITPPKPEFLASVDDEHFLLEVEPVTAAASDSFEWSVDVSEEPSRAASEHSSFVPKAADIDFNIEPAPRANTKLFAAAGGAFVLVAAAVGWFLFGGSTPAESPKAKNPPEQQSVQQTQEPSAVSSFAEPTPASTEPDQAKSSDVVTSDASPTQQPAQSKQKKPTPTPAKTAEKKKVTVDDLINDN